MAFTINSGAGGADETFDALGVTAFSGATFNAKTDEVTFVTEYANSDATAPFSYEDVVVIKKDGTPFFTGVYLTPERQESAGGARITHHLVSPWIYVEQTTYRQNWKEYNTSTETLDEVSRPHAILGHKIDGSRATIAEVITDALTQASANENRFQIGTITAPAQFPWDEIRGLKCAEVINRLYRYVPNVTISFDYSTSPPTINCVANTATHTIAITDGRDLGIKRRDDLQMQGVIVNYTETETHTPSAGDQKVIHKYSQEKYPTNTVPGSLRVAEIDIDLGSINTTVTAQKIVVEDVPTDLNSKAFWKRKHPALKGVDDADITITNGRRINTQNLPSILLEGSIQDWMNVDEEDDAIIRATFSYVIKDGGGNVLKTVPDEEYSLEHSETDANSITYTKPESSDDREGKPTGLAQAYHEATSLLHFDGQISVEAEEISLANLVGHKLNITGARTEYTTMNAIIQSVQFDAFSGLQTFVFGFPRHLLHDDMIELMRPTRIRYRSTGFRQRETGEVDKQNGDLGDRARFKQGVAVNGGGDLGMYSFKVTPNGASAYDVEGGTAFVQNQETAIAGKSAWTPGARYIRIRLVKTGNGGISSGSIIAEATESAEDASHLYYTICDTNSSPLKQLIMGDLYDRNLLKGGSPYAIPYWDDTNGYYASDAAPAHDS